ncbi:MAG: type II toxin-antitoxin system HicA family toxin [Chloroflexota bacterium]|nr:MAG: type II toxin-antitoxin system HicA family toxin [Chloroflexota bacterium]
MLQARGCVVVRQHGSHVRVRCGECSTTVPVHAGRGIPPGTLRAIERDCEPCLGPRCLR